MHYISKYIFKHQTKNQFMKYQKQKRLMKIWSNGVLQEKTSTAVSSRCDVLRCSAIFLVVIWEENHMLINYSRNEIILKKFGSNGSISTDAYCLIGIALPHIDDIDWFWMSKLETPVPSDFVAAWSCEGSRILVNLACLCARYFDNNYIFVLFCI